MPIELRHQKALLAGHGLATGLARLRHLLGDASAFVLLEDRFAAADGERLVNLRVGRPRH